MHYYTAFVFLFRSESASPCPSPASLTRFLAWGQPFLFALRRRLQADAEDVGPGTGWLGLSRDLHLREAELTRVDRGLLIQGVMCLGWRKALWFP